MALDTLLTGTSTALAVTVGIIAVLATYGYYALLARPDFPKGAPVYVSESVRHDVYTADLTSAAD
jgi:hypothetical protein